ncbi:MAG: NYN domain-containing protein [Burkholderiaceae bacterium]|nr:NYN domain-containing protein [Burkholderiaceae bacterium]MDH3461978.1 NYN domain-containing protein [Burkholderiaceae bacterium]
MTATEHIMLLIDADNVSADVIEQAVENVMATYDAIHVRRAYCTAESALTHLKLFKRLSIRPIVNVSVGKNSNDIALAVDAIDLAIAERPQVVVIVSSDSDFAPLVIRLREKGCRVEGIGQLGKTGDEAPQIYDRFLDLPHRKTAREPAKRRSSRAKPPQANEAPAVQTTVPAEVEQILLAVPALRSGNKQQLNSTVEPLRQAGLLAKRAASTKLFKKYSEWFELTPPAQPNKVQFRHIAPE